jgi:hypothetical protein
MSFRFLMLMVFAAVAVSCAHSDPTSTESTRAAAATTRPSHCAEAARAGQMDDCNAKTMAGQRPSGASVASR